MSMRATARRIASALNLLVYRLRVNFIMIGRKLVNESGLL
jgi:hypothetical protein